MAVKRFIDEDHAEILGWHAAHKQAGPSFDDLPTYGLIEHGVAAGFLILTDARVGILEYYISNPNVAPMVRSKALDDITVGLIDYGKKFGLKYFKCDTQLVTIGQRAMKHGLEFQGKFSAYFMKGS